MAIRRALGVRRVAIGVVIAFGLTSAAAVPAGAAPEFDETELTSDASEDSFGFSVAVDGDRIVVGAYLDDEKGSESGSVYVYERDGLGAWTHTQLFAPNPTAGDRFGQSVALEGDRVVVGATRDDEGVEDAGAAYVFDRDDSGHWPATTLTAFDGQIGDLYGSSVAVDGDRVVVGAPGTAVDDNPGAVYVYGLDGTGTWVGTKQVAYDGTAADLFGRSVSAGDGRIVVGAPGDDDRADSAGSAYVYEQGGVTKLTARNGAVQERYGSSVAVDGGRVVIGAPGGGAGAAYVYAEAGAQRWAETKLTASDGASGESFGQSVAVDGDRVVVGAYLDARAFIHMGAAYVYKPGPFGAWAKTKLTASDGAFFDKFGWAVAVDGDRVVVGTFADPDETDPWSVYVYDIAAAGTPPVITVPGGLTAPATTFAGAVVSYQASASDESDGVVPVDCAPASGSVFAPGSTIVTCIASDLAGNLAEERFDVFVDVPTGAAGYTILLQGISGLGLPKKVSTSLASPIKQAQRIVTDRKPGNDGTACDSFVSFQANVGVRFTAGTITAADADLLNAWAAALADGNHCVAP